jgi:hypothetical protein
MFRKITAFYSSFHTANEAVRELVAYGLPRESISVVADSPDGAYGFTEKPMNTGLIMMDSLPDEYRAGTRIGGGIGMAIGLVSGLLVGTGAWAIPGTVPAVSAGLSALGLFMLASSVGGGMTGGIIGRVLGGLIGLGIPEEEAEQYADSVRQSGVLVAVNAEQYNSGLIREVLERYRPNEIGEKLIAQREPRWHKIRAIMQPVYVEEWKSARRR